jgi:two-component system, OmpR family, alkaline phosphatase synthesis response regulator PhoP
MESASKKVLIADDEQDILEILSFNLEQNGFVVYTAKDGNDAINKAIKIVPDLIILDMMMPFKNGIEVCEILRKNIALKDKPIIILTAISNEQTHIKGLESGADDYITKPISAKVFISKVNSIFRRTSALETDAAIIEFEKLIINPIQFLVVVNGKDVVLAKKEFELLYLLASKPGRVFLRDEILTKVWGANVIVGDRTIDVHIRKVRQKLDMDCITTVKGVGYKFEL